MAEPAPTDAPDADEIGYGAALAELEGILDEIEDDSVDVDVLAARVKRAAELLRVCRGRITAARVEVTRIVADLDPSSLDLPQGGSDGVDDVIPDGP